MRILATILTLLTIGVGCSSETADAQSDRARDKLGMAEPYKERAGQAIPRELIDRDDVEAVRKWLDQGADIDAPVAVGAPALMIAIAMRANRVIELLLERGADVNRASESGETALISCAILNRFLLAQRLVALGADLKAEADGGRCVAGIVAHLGHNDWIEYLLDQGVDVNHQNQVGETMLHRACAARKIETVELLLERGARVNILTNDGRSPLTESARVGCFECAQELIERDANVHNPTNFYLETPLILATRYERVELVKLLLEAGADPTAQDHNGQTALDHAERRGRTDLVELLK